MIPAHVAAAFDFQSKACSSLGSPFMGQLMRLCATMAWPEGRITERIFNWQGDIGPRAQSVPLRLAGALHALHLQRHARLAAVYPPHQPGDATLWDAVADTLTSDSAFIDAFIDSAPQTNEVRRSAVLVALGQVLAHHFPGPIRTSELGASGGLNIHWDDYAVGINGQVFGAQRPVLTLGPDWTGDLPPKAQPVISAHAGVDLNPLDPSAPDDALRLQAYLWPDQPHRLELTRAAMGAARTKITQGDAIDWLRPRLVHQPGQMHLIYSTIAWQYFPETKQSEGEALIEAAGETATDQAPLAWFGMENDGGTKGAALTLRFWPGNVRCKLGRADFHGRWVNWINPPLS
ncbi:DUF2332 family protein [Yoonia sp. SS1-5]|uniref:DUF2332 domain-containing protein n=1 Tax=Yoonia rhodophyticola TaxID=3137370 RepID=A0AAN0NKA6_9RHOB